MIAFQFNLPNCLTIARILLIPVFVVLVIFDLHVLSAVIFVVAAITDYLDGYLARKFEQVSDFGKLMDPIADKILVMSALVLLVAERHISTGESLVPAWIVVMILARETWVNGLRSLASKNGIVVAAGDLGKIKSFLQMVAIVFLLLHELELYKSTFYTINAGYVGERLLLASLVFSYWSGVEYTWKVLAPAKTSESC